jgi:4-carboxymuconolactone decarboxylase
VVSEELFEKGLEMRRAVVGAEDVGPVARAGRRLLEALPAPGQRVLLGAGWGREALSRRDRSLLDLAMISILNRSAEFKLHLRRALRNGCIKEEIKDTLIQMSIYAGIPAGVEAFHLATEVFAEVEAEGGLQAGAC